FQPAALGNGTCVAVIVGRVLSTLTVTAVSAALPARSTAAPRTIWPAPSAVIAAGAGHDAMPDRPSVQVNVTIASRVIHPALFGSGCTEATIVGAVLSILTVTLAEAVLPALSTAVPVTTCAAPSVVTVFDGEHVAIPDPVSAHVKFTRTSIRFQPVSFGGGTAVAEIVGGVSSAPRMRTVNWLPGLPRSSMRRVF